MTTKHPPNLYINPPSFDIELDEFQTLPLCRLEAFQLLRSGREVTRSSANSPENRSEGVDETEVDQKKCDFLEYLSITT